MFHKISYVYSNHVIVNIVILNIPKQGQERVVVPKHEFNILFDNFKITVAKQI